MKLTRPIQKQDTIALAKLFEAYVETVVNKTEEDNSYIYAATSLHIVNSLFLFSSFVYFEPGILESIFNSFGFMYKQIEEGNTLLYNEVKHECSNDK